MAPAPCLSTTLWPPSRKPVAVSSPDAALTRGTSWTATRRQSHAGDALCLGTKLSGSVLRRTELRSHLPAALAPVSSTAPFGLAEGTLRHSVARSGDRRRSSAVVAEAAQPGTGPSGEDGNAASSPETLGTSAGQPEERPTSNTDSSSSSRTDEVVKVISNEAEVSVTAIVGTHLVQEAQRRHGLAPTAAAALGRLLMGTLLLGAKQGPGEAVQVSFSGRGPIGRVTALASGSTDVKGFVGNPACDPPLSAKGKLDVGAAVGPGVLTVVRTHPSWQQPYTGTVPIQTGEIADDLAHYLAESEQVNTALGLGVAAGKDGVVVAAGGFLVQVLPFCSEETLQLLERNVAAMPAVSELIQAGVDGLGMAARLLEGLDWRQAGEVVSPGYGPCGAETLRPRMLQAVLSLGVEDTRKLLQEQGGKIEVKCEFCAETLTFLEDEILPASSEAVTGPTPA